jgi:signal peptidase II
MHPMLAASTERWRERGASGIVRSLRASCHQHRERFEVRFILLLSLPLYALDQITKWFVLRFVAPDQPRAVIADFFDLVHVTNTGAAFGILPHNNLIFIILCFLALIVIVPLLVRRHEPDRLRDISLSLLLAGVLGNLTDRLIHGHVIDFLLFDLHVPLAHPWPAFNVADSCICIAVVCFIIHSFKQKEAPPAQGS